MKQKNVIKTTCAYCGVGCGIEATVEDAPGHVVSIKGDPDHPSNFGRLCSKGAALGQTVSLEGRLLHPEIHGRRCDWDGALQYVARGFADIIDEYGPEAVAFYVSGQLLTEDYYVANKLMKGFIGSANIDTNSRLCMSSAVVGYKRAFGADSVPCSYEDLEMADLLVLVGSNTAWCHPVLYQRMRAAKEANPRLRVVVVDPRATATCDIADLHLAIHPGADGTLFNGLLSHLATHGGLEREFIRDHTRGFEDTLREARASAAGVEATARACGLAEALVRQFFDWFLTTEKTVTLYSQGINQSSSGSDKCNAIINCHLATGRIGRAGMGPFSFTGQPNAMGGREVGGMANTLAAHMDLENPAHVRRVGRFWGSDRVAAKPGLNAVELFDAIDEGKIKAIWIMATNPVVSMPDADRVRRALGRCELVVVSDCIRRTDTTACAHVLLPAAGWSEKDGTVTNIERRICRQRALFPPAGEAKPDWWIVSQVARRMGFVAGFDYRSSADVFREHAALSAFENDSLHGLRDFDLSALAAMDDEAYDNLEPIQWPVSAARPGGTPRLFEDGRYFTRDGRARFVAVEPRPPVNPVNAQYPLVLNTGRVRDQWHTMTRTALASKLNQHKPEPFVEIHPEDAVQYGLEQGALAQIESHWGSMLARVEVTGAQRPGSLFVPMHWTDQLSTRGRVGALVNPVVDPHSGQPESKQTPARIAPFSAAWHGMILSRRPLSLEGLPYKIIIPGEGYIRYAIASDAAPDDLKLYAWQCLEAVGAPTSEWIECEDLGAGCYRAARFSGERLESCVFLAPSWHLPDPGWLSTLFAKETLTRKERRAVLGGEPPAGEEDVGRVVCSCFNVGEKSILNAIRKKKLNSVGAIGECLNAGQGCGSCIPELKQLIQKGAG